MSELRGQRALGKKCGKKSVSYNSVRPHLMSETEVGLIRVPLHPPVRLRFLMASPRDELLLMLSLLLRFVPVVLPAAKTAAAAAAPAAAAATSSAVVSVPTACDLTDAASQARARASAAPPPTAAATALDGFVGEVLLLLETGISCRLLHPEPAPAPMLPIASSCAVRARNTKSMSVNQNIGGFFYARGIFVRVQT